MKVRIFEHAAAVAAAVAAHLAAVVREQPSLVLGLPAGRTPIATYAELRRLYAAGLLDMSQARTFSIDEFVGLDASHPGSYRHFMGRHLFEGVNIDPGRRHVLDGTADDLDEECRRYEAAIEAAGGIDLQLVGIGVNGHIGFNEPADALAARTHRVRLHEATRRSNAALFGDDLAQVPTEALSMGMATMLNAAAIVLVATGSDKADAIARAVRGPLTTAVPASLLQVHRRAEIYLDREAAAGLTQDRGGPLPVTSC